MSDEKQKPAPAPHPKPFAIQMGNDFCHNFYVPFLALIVRGDWSQTRMANRKNADGSEIGPANLGQAMSQMPEIPGQQLRFDARTSTVTLVEPLNRPEHKRLVERIERAARNAMVIMSDQKYKLDADVATKLGADEFKTLAREARRHIDAGRAKTVEGVVPSMEELDALPGGYLYDPSFEGRKPRYEHQLEAWMQKLEAAA